MRIGWQAMGWALALVGVVAAHDAGRAADDEGAGEWLVDDFSAEAGESRLGTRWRFFTDTVMGGVSRGSAGVEILDGRRCLRLRGRVSLENSGGFLQSALDLDMSRRVIDVSRFTGVRIVIRGNGEEYYLHIRSGDTRLPWQFYAAPFGTTGQWTQVDVPFAAFRPAALSKPLDARHLSRIAIVAANKAIDADVAVARVSFYG